MYYSIVKWNFVFLLLLVWLYRTTTWSELLTGYSHTQTVRKRLRLCQTQQTQSRTITASQTPMPTATPRSLQIRTCPAPASETDQGVSAHWLLNSTNRGSTHTKDYTHCWFDISFWYFIHLIFFLSQRLWTVCLHQSHGNIHNVWSLCVSYQKRGQVCWL